MISERKILNDITVPHLDVKQIQTIGKNYLEKHSKANKNKCLSFFDAYLHTNHETARKLKAFQGGVDEYENWYFLANCYAGLVKNKGELATEISKIFSETFGNLTFAFFIIHSGSDLLQNDEHYSPAEKSQALKLQIDVYHYTHYQEMFNQRDDLKNLSFGLADKLTNEIIQKIGRDYLAQHPIEKGCFVKLQNNEGDQNCAKMLLNYNKNTSPVSKWRFLADVYAGLSESRGDLSKSIIHLFKNAFNKQVYTHILRYHATVHGGYIYNEWYNPNTISLALNAIVKQYYCHKMREVLLCQPIKNIKTPSLST